MGRFDDFLLRNRCLAYSFVMFRIVFLHMHYHNCGVLGEIRHCTVLEDRKCRKLAIPYFNMFNPLLRVLCPYPLIAHSGGAVVLQILTAQVRFTMLVRPRQQHPSEQCERLPSYLEVCLSTGQLHSRQREARHQWQMRPTELHAQEHDPTFVLPPIYTKNPDGSNPDVLAGFMESQSHQKGLSDPAPIQSGQTTCSVSLDESQGSPTCFSETSTPSQKRSDILDDDWFYRKSAPGHHCQRVGFETDEELACRESECQNATRTYSNSESCPDSPGQQFHASVGEQSHDYDEIPSIAPPRGWYDPDDKYSRNTIEFTRSWSRDEFLAAFWSLPRRPTYGEGRPRPNQTDWDRPEPRTEDFPNQRAFKAAYSKWSHRRAEHDRRGRHFVVQTDIATSTSEVAYVLADRDPVLQARWRSAQSNGTSSSLMPGKDDQLFGSAYMHRLSAVVVHSEHEGRVLAEARIEQLQAQIQNLKRQLTSDHRNEHMENRWHLTAASSPTKRRKVSDSPCTP